MFLVEAAGRDRQCAASGVLADKSNDISIAGDSLPPSREDAQGGSSARSRQLPRGDLGTKCRELRLRWDERCTLYPDECSYRDVCHRWLNFVVLRQRPEGKSSPILNLLCG